MSPQGIDGQLNTKRRTAALTVGVGLAVAALISVPLALASRNSASAPGTRPGSPGSPTPTADAAHPPASSFPGWGDAAGCASSSGLQAISASELQNILSVMGTEGQSEQADFENSDQAYWPDVRSNYDSAPTPVRAFEPGQAVAKRASLTPATKSDLAGLLTHNCGAAVTSYAVVVAVCPPGAPGECEPSHYPGQSTEQVWLKRDGRYLHWLDQP